MADLTRIHGAEPEPESSGRWQRAGRTAAKALGVAGVSAVGVFIGSGVYNALQPQDEGAPDPAAAARGAVQADMRGGHGSMCMLGTEARVTMQDGTTNRINNPIVEPAYDSSGTEWQAGGDLVVVVLGRTAGSAETDMEGFAEGYEGVDHIDYLVPGKGEAEAANASACLLAPASDGAPYFEALVDGHVAHAGQLESGQG